MPHLTWKIRRMIQALRCWSTYRTLAGDVHEGIFMILYAFGDLFKVSYIALEVYILSVDAFVGNRDHDLASLFWLHALFEIQKWMETSAMFDIDISDTFTQWVLQSAHRNHHMEAHFHHTLVNHKYERLIIMKSKLWINCEINQLSIV